MKKKWNITVRIRNVHPPEYTGCLQQPPGRKEDILFMMASRINVATTSHLHGIGYDSPAYRFVHAAYDRLVNNGKLKENIRKTGCCNIIIATSNTNAI